MEKKQLSFYNYKMITVSFLMFEGWFDSLW